MKSGSIKYLLLPLSLPFPRLSSTPTPSTSSPHLLDHPTSSSATITYIHALPFAVTFAVAAAVAAAVSVVLDFDFVFLSLDVPLVIASALDLTPRTRPRSCSHSPS